MLFSSIPFWFSFEAYNLALKNWYYVFALRSDWLGAITTCLAFATVLPACFFHTELLKALGAWSEGRCRPVRVEGWVLKVCAGVGAVCIVAPLAWPRYAFWMVWGATLGVPEAINYRVGAPSLLRDLESGRCGRLLRLLAGGLAAGIAWELFNSRARCKWIYTVPGFEEGKVLEMPLPGFLGFPILALGAFSFYSLLCHCLRGSRTWEKPDTQEAAMFSRFRQAVGILAALAFTALTYPAVLNITVQSRRPVLRELDGLDAPSIERLRGAHIPTPERLYRAVRADGLVATAVRTNVSPERLGRAYRHAALALHKGMGPRRAKLLQAAGLSSVADLVSANSEDLFGRLRELALYQGDRPPRLAEVKVWIRAARLSGETRP